MKSVINLSREQGGLKREESELLHAVLAFGQTPVKEAMVPRARIVLLPVSATFEQVEALCREHRYSRYPVFRQNTDDIVGILHVKDLFDVSDSEESAFEMSRYLRPAIFVPELKRSEDLFREMRRRRFHMAVVVDESGAVAGLVTLEDLIEQIVGDIFDEHDEPAGRPNATARRSSWKGRILWRRSSGTWGPRSTTRTTRPSPGSCSGSSAAFRGPEPARGRASSNFSSNAPRPAPSSASASSASRQTTRPRRPTTKGLNDVTASPRVVTLVPGDGMDPRSRPP